MSRRPAVVDTNVVVAGLLTRDAASPTARLLDGMLEGRFPFLLSVELLAEYRQVLLRPRIRRRHGLTAGEVDRLLQAIAYHAIVRDPATGSGGGGGDEHLFRLLGTDPVAVLVTGDRALLDDSPPGASVLRPRAYLELLDT